jgi:hypothetical protein
MEIPSAAEKSIFCNPSMSLQVIFGDFQYRKNDEITIEFFAYPGKVHVRIDPTSP